MDESDARPWKRKRDLPRLPRAWYQGRAWVFWTHTVDKRATGWLDDRFHLRFRELLLHAQAREHLACPLYVLMPDHIHLIWMGCWETSDQILAGRYLRGQLNKLLHPSRLQKQPHDHVVRESEREASSFGGSWNYVARNPLRAGLVDTWQAYPFLGALIPGFAGLKPAATDFFHSFWRAHSAFTERIKRLREGESTS